ncbi:MAG: hypothetical protein QM607_00785 [Microbacterium sp.]
MEMHEGAEVIEFADVAALRAWLDEAGSGHPAVWVRLRRAGPSTSSGTQSPSVTFHDLLTWGIAHGWSESTRHAYDRDSYLQKFGPRRARGTASERNRRIAAKLDAAGHLTEAGRRALGMAG